jgi:DNA-binding CsgD family transcriptional regulator
LARTGIRSRLRVVSALLIDLMGSGHERSTVFGHMIESDLINEIYGTIADPQRWSQVLVHLSDHLDAAGGMLAYCAPPGKGRTLQVLGRLSEERSAIYREHYVWNPWTCAMKDVPFGKAVTADSLVERGAISRTAFYADVLAPQKQLDILNIVHRALSRDGAVGGIGFPLEARGVERAPANVRRLQRLGPHIGRALDASMEVGRAADGAQKLAAVLDIMPGPALLLDRDGRIAHANAAAETLLREADGVCVDRATGFALAAALPSEAAALRRALALAREVAAGTGLALSEPVRISRLSGAAPLLVIPVPLPPPAFALWDLVDTARVLVLIVDPSSGPGGTEAILRQSYGLTAAEARVALLVGKGLSGPQAAIALGISDATVKTHLGRCFAKLGVHSQVMLSRLINALPVVRRASGHDFEQMT